MKTIYTHSNRLANNSKANLVLILVIFVFNINALISQDNKKSPYRIGLGFGSHISGNSHGGIQEIHASLYNGKSLFSIGSCFQKRTNSICGGMLSFNYMLTGKENFSTTGDMSTNDEKLQLYFFSYIQYLHNTALSNGAVKREQTFSKGNDNLGIDFNKLKLSTADFCLGFGLNVKLNKGLVWGNYIGVSTYYHTSYAEGMYAGKIALVLVIGTSISLNYFQTQ